MKSLVALGKFVYYLVVALVTAMCLIWVIMDMFRVHIPLESVFTLAIVLVPLSILIIVVVDIFKEVLKHAKNQNQS